MPCVQSLLWVSIVAILIALPGRCSAQVRLVEEGRAAAVVVTAADPSPIAAYAAQELVEHVRRSSGASVPIVRETEIPDGYASRVFVGVTAAARAQGIVPDAMPADTFVLRTVGGDLFIVGDENDEDPLSDSNSRSGTLFGVYEILERAVGVRWLWPGELGTYVPRAADITVAPVDETISPRLLFRHIFWTRVRETGLGDREYDPGDERMGFSAEGLRAYASDLQVYLRRHRMGFSERKPRTGHHFLNWWGRYGHANPDWFMLNEHGTRGPVPGGNLTHVPMCISNPDLQRIVVEHWDGTHDIRVCEVDHKDVCRCEECLAWDGPQPEPPPEFVAGFYTPRGVSDRYARFWLAVQQLAAQRDPEALVTTYMYYNYFPAPVTDIQLNRNIYGEFVNWGEPHIDFFPMTEEAFEWLKEQWLGWANTGMRMAYRPNYMHDGYVMPHVNTRQAGEFFQFAVEHGMEGASFDSLTGQWATQGPKIYLHMRLFAKPELDIERIRQEFFEAFGPAAEHIERYFDYWEDWAIANHGRLLDLYRDVGSRWSRFHIKAHVAFPPESFEPAEAFLEEALVAAQADPAPEFARRVEFLQLGLEHAKLSARLGSFFDGPDAARQVLVEWRRLRIPEDDERFAQAQAALQELVAFRRAHEALYISDYFYGAAWRERRWWGVDDLWEAMQEAPGTD